MTEGSIYIFGAGGLGKEIFYLNKNAKQPLIISGFVDEISRQTCYCGLKILNHNHEGASMILGVSDPKIKIRLANSHGNHLCHENIFHKTIEGIEVNKIGFGVVAFSGSTFSGDVTIGNFVLLHMNCTIGHDTVIGDFCSIFPGVHLSGNVNIGVGSLVGSGSVVLPGIIIGENCTIGAGAVVTKNIPNNAVVIGNPGKIIKFN